MEDVEELCWEGVEEAREQHGLNVGDELGLADQAVQPGALLQALYTDSKVTGYSSRLETPVTC